MNARVEDLAHKMILARQIREESQRKHQLQEQTRLGNTQESYFRRKVELSEKEIMNKEKRIQEMEKKEAELLEKIKVTQSL